jgi:hypothetical protein
MVRLYQALQKPVSNSRLQWLCDFEMTYPKAPPPRDFASLFISIRCGVPPRREVEFLSLSLTQLWDSISALMGKGGCPVDKDLVASKDPSRPYKTKSELKSKKIIPAATYGKISGKVIAKQM